MAISREDAGRQHTEKTRHNQFSETIYGVICSACHNYILIDHTNCPPQPAGNTKPAAKRMPSCPLARR